MQDKTIKANQLDLAPTLSRSALPYCPLTALTSRRRIQGFTAIDQVNRETKQLYAYLRQNPTAFETTAIQLAT